jgi:hypothetical protein
MSELYFDFLTAYIKEGDQLLELKVVTTQVKALKLTCGSLAHQSLTYGVCRLLTNVTVC